MVESLELRRTGISRKMDALGRVVVPMEIRREMRIQDGDAFEILADPKGEFLLLRRIELTCDFCGRGGDLREIKERTVCKECLREIHDAVLAQGA